MEKRTGTKTASVIYKTRAVLIATVFTAFSAILGLSLSGCDKAAELVLSADKIYLDVGETRDITPYVSFVPFSAQNKSFTLTSDSDCVRVSGSSVTAEAAGEATLTVSSAYGASELSVVCSYNASFEPSIEADGKTVQTATDKAEPVSFRVSGTSDPDIIWYVNGEQKHVGEEFVFEPHGYGLFVVRAVAGGVSCERELFMYRPTDAYGVYAGELEQRGDRSPVVFSVEEVADTRNPPSSIVWTVDGEAAGSGEAFEFVPDRAADYTVKLSVNGVERKISGKDEIIVSAAGDRAPSGIVCIKEDKIYATWRDGSYARGVTVTDPDGTRRSISAGDAAYATAFGAGYVELTYVIDVCADEPGTYRLRILGEAAGEEFEFTQYPLATAKYMDDKIFVSDAFVSSADEAADALAELYVCGKTSGELYLSRELDGGAAVRAISERADMLKVDCDISVSGSLVSVRLRDAINAPSGSGAAETAAMQYTLLPHIEYEEGNRRGRSYVFEIDKQKQSASVTNTEQLLYCVTHGIKPLPEGAAKTVYDRARATLMNIIGRDYDDMRKVHAIYDWAQWSIRRSYADGKAVSDRFIEGAFSVGGSHAVATDEGTAKAVALLCATEDIPSRVACKDGKYFAEVTVNGKTLVIDAFGGKNSTLDCEVISGGASALPARDISSHAGFDTFFLQKHIYKNVYFDYYIDRSELEDAASVRAAVFYAFDGQSYGNVTVRDYSTSQITNTEYGVEFKLDPRIADDERSTVYGNIVSAVGEYVKPFEGYSDDDIKIENYDGIVRVHVLIRRR